MKKINTYIVEKLILNKDTKDPFDIFIDKYEIIVKLNYFLQWLCSDHDLDISDQNTLTDTKLSDIKNYYLDLENYNISLKELKEYLLKVSDKDVRINLHKDSFDTSMEFSLPDSDIECLIPVPQDINTLEALKKDIESFFK